MEELAKKVNEIFNQFLREGMGSAITQFNMKGLRDTVIPLIQTYKPIKKEVKKEDVKE